MSDPPVERASKQHEFQPGGDPGGNGESGGSPAGGDAQRGGQWNSEKVAENGGQQDTQDGIAKRRAGIAQCVIGRGVQPAERRSNQADASTRKNAPNVHRVSMLKSPRLVDGAHDDVA